MVYNPEKRFYVYEWYIVETGEVFYVGKGTKSRYKTRKRDNAFFMRMLSTHDCKSRIVKNKLTEKEAFDLETERIAYYKQNTDHRLTNVLDGGNQPPTYYGDDSHSKRKDVRDKIGHANKMRYVRNPELRKIQSENFKAFLKTDAGKQFIIKSRLAKTDEVKERMINNMLKTVRSDEFRKRHSKLMTEVNNRPEVKAKRTGEKHAKSRRVSQFDLEDNFIKEYGSLAEAKDETGISVESISKCLRGTRKTGGGYKWRYSDNKIVKPYVRRKDIQYNPVNKRPIIQYDKEGKIIREYESIAEAVRVNDYSNNANILLNLKGATEFAYGYKWLYK